MKPASTELQFEYHWRAGSMPPPHHYAYSITGSAASRCRIVFVPGYAIENTPTWIEEFDIDPDAWAALQKALTESRAWQRGWNEVESHAVGGSLRSFVFEEGERRIEIPAQLGADDRQVVPMLEDAVEALVPEAIWQALRARHQEYKKTAGDD